MDAICKLVVGCDAVESVSRCQKWGGNTHCGPHRAVDLLLASSVGVETKAGREAYLWDPRMSLDTETMQLGDVERVTDGWEKIHCCGEFIKQLTT